MTQWSQPVPIDEDLAILIQEIDANLSHLETITARLSSEQFNWRSATNAWSIGQCVAHLNIVNSADLAPLQRAIEHGRARGQSGVGPFHSGFFSRKIIASLDVPSIDAPSMDLPLKRKFKAPKLYLPPAESDPAQSTAEYRRISAELRRLALNANGLDLARVKTAIPAFPPPLRWFIRMPLGARLTLITTHDRRHLWQAEQVRTHKEFPA